MAKSQWGKVYYKDIFAGRLQEEPGGRVVFTYDESYLDASQPAISFTLPLTAEPHVSEQGLHPFFDNLVAEGWLQRAQARALGVDSRNRFALLLGFGFDLAGAVSVIDPARPHSHNLDHLDDVTKAALSARASLSGVQRKLLVVKDGNIFRPVGPNELSTHIAKLPSGNLEGLVELEYLSTRAAQKLMPDDDTVDVCISGISSIHEHAIVIPRFDRICSDRQVNRIHFEEFNQLLGKFSGDEKYEGSYEDMGRFIVETPGCVPAEADRLFRRVLSCLLLGNTDAHLKNFAMLHAHGGLRLAPAYDLVASSTYPDFRSIALSVAGIANMDIHALKPKHIVVMGEGFGLSHDSIELAVSGLGNRLAPALAEVNQSSVGHRRLRDQICQLMEKRWNGSFKLIGQFLSKKRSSGAKNKS